MPSILCIFFLLCLYFACLFHSPSHSLRYFLSCSLLPRLLLLLRRLYTMSSLLPFKCTLSLSLLHWTCHTDSFLVHGALERQRQPFGVFSFSFWLIVTCRFVTRRSRTGVRRRCKMQGKRWGWRRQDWPTDLSPSEKWHERGESYGMWWGLVLLQYLTSGRGNQCCSLRQPTILPIYFNIDWSMADPTLGPFCFLLAPLESICVKFVNFSFIRVHPIFINLVHQYIAQIVFLFILYHLTIC